MLTRQQLEQVADIAERCLRAMQRDLVRDFPDDAQRGAALASAGAYICATVLVGIGSRVPEAPDELVTAFNFALVPFGCEFVRVERTKS
jgi:hypothetical protein